MAEVHQSPVVHPSKQVESKETLVRFLDDLLERYLHLLDRYQTLQQFLAQLLSKVRIDLGEFLDSCSIRTGLSITCPSQLLNPKPCSLRPESLR